MKSVGSRWKVGFLDQFCARSVEFCVVAPHEAHSGHSNLSMDNECAQKVFVVPIQNAVTNPPKSFGCGTKFFLYTVSMLQWKARNRDVLRVRGRSLNRRTVEFRIFYSRWSQMLTKINKHRLTFLSSISFQMIPVSSKMATFVLYPLLNAD